MKTLKELESMLEKAWEKFADIPMNPETERMEERFRDEELGFDFPAGTHREEIWKWFDDRYPKGIYYFLFGTEKQPTANHLKICKDSECAFSYDGICKYSLVSGKEGCVPAKIDWGNIPVTIAITATATKPFSDLTKGDVVYLPTGAQIIVDVDAHKTEDPEETWVFHDEAGTSWFPEDFC